MVISSIAPRLSKEHARVEDLDLKALYAFGRAEKELKL